MPDIALEALDKHNWLKVCDLRVSDDQRAIFSVENIYWIGISRYEEKSELFAIKHAGEYAGLIGGGLDEDGVSGFINPLMVDARFQRRGIATAAIELMIDTLIEKHDIPRVYIGHREQNAAAAALYEKLGFRVVERFGGNCKRMLVIDQQLSVVPFLESDIPFLCALMNEPETLAALHMTHTDAAYWQEAYSLWQRERDDERRFIIRRRGAPCGWLKQNGLSGWGIAWISMLVVAPRLQRRGIGRFAVDFAIEYIRQRGFERVCIRTSADNAAAQQCYRACGFELTETGPYADADGVRYTGCTFEKEIAR